MIRGVFWTLILALAAGVAAPGAEAAPSQILYGSDWTGQFKILAADPAGVRRPADVSIVRTPCAIPEQRCGFIDVTASPDGRNVAFGSLDLEHVWIRRAHGTLRPLLPVGSLPVWRADSRRLAYVARDGLHIANADGRNDRLVDADKTDMSPAWRPENRGLSFLRRDPRTLTRTMLTLRNGRIRTVASLGLGCTTTPWSADGRFFACIDDTSFYFNVQLFTASGAKVGPFLASDAEPVWSPTGAQLALAADLFSPNGVSRSGVRIIDARTLRIRTLRTGDDAIALAWAPHGHSIAYISSSGRGSRRHSGDLRVVTLNGKVRTVVPADGVAGGTMTRVRWTRNPGATAWPQLPPQNGALTDGPVSWLATAGDGVAYVACALPFVWSSAATAPLLLPAPTTERSDEFSSGCRSRLNRQRAEGIAINSRAALYDWCLCPMAYSSVQAVDLSTTTATEAGHGEGAPSLGRGSGTVLGDESLLVFSRWQAVGVVNDTRAVKHQSIQRVDGDGCPCPVIAEADGLLEPLDVDHGRIAVRRGDSMAILDANGTQLLSLAVTPLAAQLSDRHLLVLVPRELRDYDAGTGQLLHTWTLGPISVGRECQGWFDPGCFIGRAGGDTCDITGYSERDCGGEPAWRLEDASHGLVSYILDGKVHLLRLADGADAMVDWGTLSRFRDSGLVYADGARLHRVAFDDLPLH